MIYLPSKPDTGKRITLIGLFTNVVLIVFKFWGGITGHSRALIADGFHSVSDIVSDLVVLWGLKLGDKGPDLDHPFGHGKIETMSTLAMAVVIIGTGLGIGVKAVFEIHHNAYQTPEFVVIIIAAVSVISKEVLYHLTRRTGKRLNRPVLVSNAWHHRSDALSSLTVLAGALAMQFNPQWDFLDSYTAIIVSLMIVKSGANIFYQSAKDIIDTAPDPQINSIIKEISRQIVGIQIVDEIKLRRSGRFLIASIAIGVNPDIPVTSGFNIARDFEKELKKVLPDLLDVTVTVFPYKNDSGAQ